MPGPTKGQIVAVGTFFGEAFDDLFAVIANHHGIVGRVKFDGFDAAARNVARIFLRLIKI